MMMMMTIMIINSVGHSVYLVAEECKLRTPYILNLSPGRPMEKVWQNAQLPFKASIGG